MSTNSLSEPYMVNIEEIKRKIAGYPSLPETTSIEPKPHVSSEEILKMITENPDYKRWYK